MRTYVGAYSAWVETNTSHQPAHAGDKSRAFTLDGIGHRLNCLLDVHTIFNSSLVGIIKTENPHCRNGPFIYSIPQPKTYLPLTRTRTFTYNNRPHEPTSTKLLAWSTGLKESGKGLERGGKDGGLSTAQRKHCTSRQNSQQQLKGQRNILRCQCLFLFLSMFFIFQTYV